MGTAGTGSTSCCGSSAPSAWPPWASWNSCAIATASTTSSCCAAWNPIRRRRQAEAFRIIEDDLDNIRQAWEHALERQERERLSQAIDAVYLFADKRGRFREGADLLQETRDRLAPTPAADGELWLRLDDCGSASYARSFR